jgi:DNA-directed RNA polymerase specialized sigma24 family protein
MRVAQHWSLCRDDALDAYQRALEIYVRRIDSLDPATEIAWMRVVVKHEALAVRRQRAEALPVEDVDVDGHAAEAQRPVDDLLAGRERVRRSAEALRRIKPDEAKALMLKAQGLSYEEIAESLSWTYTNVMATLALFIALGGSSYAALSISGKSIERRSIPAKKLKRNSLTGKEIRESRLAPVRWAKDAYRVGGFTGAELKIRCPDDTFPIADVCVERAPRPPSAYGSAVLDCADVGTPAGPGRRLPTHGELTAALTSVTVASGGELTSNVYPSGSDPGRLDVLYVTDQVGSIALTPDTAAGGKAFRCVTDPLN